jgi:transcriptional regulator with XRE-family HTH domain
MNTHTDGEKALRDGIRRVFREAREDADLTQEELGKRLRFTRNMVANMEIGRRDVRVADLIRLGVAVGVDPARLVTEMVARSRREVL